MRTVEFMETLKILNGLNRTDWENLLNVHEWGFPEEFDIIWETRRKIGLFHGLCALDLCNQERMLNYAREKMKLYMGEMMSRDRIRECIHKALECMPKPVSSGDFV